MAQSICGDTKHVMMTEHDGGCIWVWDDERWGAGFEFHWKESDYVVALTERQSLICTHLRQAGRHD